VRGVAGQQSAFRPPDAEPLDRRVTFARIGTWPACLQQPLGFVEGVHGASESRLGARVLAALAVPPSSTLVDRRLCQRWPVVPREQLCGSVEVLERLIEEAFCGILLCPGCVQRHLARKLQLQPVQLPATPSDRRHPVAAAARLRKVAGHQLDRYPHRCRPQ